MGSRAFHALHTLLLRHCFLAHPVRIIPVDKKTQNGATWQRLRLLAVGQRLEYAGSLSRFGELRTFGSEQNAGLVGEQRLKFVVGKSRKVFRVDKRVTAAVQTHLTVHLSTRTYIQVIS